MSNFQEALSRIPQKDSNIDPLALSVTFFWSALQNRTLAIRLNSLLQLKTVVVTFSEINSLVMSLRCPLHVSLADIKEEV